MINARHCSLLVIAALVLYSTRATTFFKLNNETDFDLRYNEVCCSHEGINPFQIWDGKLSSEKYTGLHRSDRSDADEEKGKLQVHAYPPWHTTYFYWYAWLPHDFIRVAAGVANLGLLLGLMIMVFRMCRHLSDSECLYVIASVSIYLFNKAIGVINTGNYSLMIAFLLVGFYWALSRGHDKTAGFIWALTLIKPQLTVLLVCPLLVGKKFTVIATAGITCLLATLWPSYLYGESPVDLILEIPKLGTPYMAESTRFRPPLFTVFEQVFGSSTLYILAAGGFLTCLLLSFMTRKCKHWWIKSLPATALALYWTYVQRMDHVITWNVILFTLLASINRIDIPMARSTRRLLLFSIVVLLACEVAFVGTRTRFLHCIMQQDAVSYLAGICTTLSSAMQFLIFAAGIAIAAKPRNLDTQVAAR